MTAQGELVLLLAGNALRLGQEFGGDAHRQRPLGRVGEEFWVQVQAGIHGDVLHVLQSADDLHVLAAGHDRMSGLVDRLQARTAKPVDRGGGRGAGQAGHQRHGPGDVEALLALLLRIAEDHVFDLAGSMPPRSITASTTDRQVVAADVAKDPFLFVGARPMGVPGQFLYVIEDI